jgi:Domain of unknown function (DUF4387)
VTSSRTIRELVSSVRSKNAGPFSLTFDLFFPDAATWQEVVDQSVLTPGRVADLYGLRPEEVQVFNFFPALAIKVSIPRLVPGGAPGDSDVAGGQQFVPLLSIAV